MKRTLPIILSLGVLLGAGALWNFNQGDGVSAPSLSAAVAQEGGDVDTSGVLEMSIGNPDADVTVIEYASFTCPHCRSFHENVMGKLKANYVDTGKINFIYREVYFDRFGLWAGMVARCGGPVRYFGIADLLYEKQSEWLAGGEPDLIVENLRKLGKSAGLSSDQLEMCLNDGEKAQAMVALFQENSTADAIRSTPTFIINGKSYSNMSYDDFAEILDEKLGE